MKQDSKSRKTAQKPIKKPQKIINRNYFARACRFLGRIMMFAGLLTCIGTAAVLILQSFQPPHTSTPSASIPVSTPTSPASVDPVSVAFSAILTFVIILVAITCIIYLAYKYNSYARGFINWIARQTKLPIHFVELLIPLLCWTTTIIMLIPTFPLATVPLIFIFIFNEFFFLLGWIAYGCPIYKN